jgi:hypothetical protein
MAQLIDIAPLTETVRIRGAKIPVRGVTAQGIASLLFRFPELHKMWATGTWDTDQLLAMSDDVLAAVIAAGIDGDPDTESNARNLALDEKAELLGAIVRVTMPRGPVPFMETLAGLMGGVNGVPSLKGRASKSPKPSPG